MKCTTWCEVGGRVLETFQTSGKVACKVARKSPGGVEDDGDGGGERGDVEEEPIEGGEEPEPVEGGEEPGPEEGGEGPGADLEEPVELEK
jgi:hypothetical protein